MNAELTEQDVMCIRCTGPKAGCEGCPCYEGQRVWYRYEVDAGSYLVRDDDGSVWEEWLYLYRAVGYDGEQIQYSKKYDPSTGKIHDYGMDIYYPFED